MKKVLKIFLIIVILIFIVFIIDMWSFANEGNIGFKEGQEIKVYYDGMINLSYPAGINKVYKIKITKEESEVEIPMELVRNFNSSEENISITINDFTPEKLSITITDTNELPFEYSDNYKIEKKNKEAEKENQNRKFDQNRVTPATKNSTSAYNPEPLKNVWKELLKISYDTNNIITENPNKGIVNKIFDLEKIYGILEEGEYKFKLYFKDARINYIEIEFTIDENRKVSYNEPTIEY